MGTAVPPSNFYNFATGFKMTQITEKISKIQRIDDDQQVIYGLVYAPLDLDTYGEAMTAADIQIMAHRFLQLEGTQTIDEMHDELPKQDCYPIESFIARKGDPEGYPEGGWVLGVKIDNDETWGRIKTGELNGFSFQAMVQKVAAIVEIQYEQEHIGQTAFGGNDEHQHLFFAQLNEEGNITTGRTSTVNGHSHKILRGTATEQDGNHSHRFSV